MSVVTTDAARSKEAPETRSATGNPSPAALANITINVGMDDTVIALRRQYLRAHNVNGAHLGPLASLTWEICRGRY